MSVIQSKITEHATTMKKLVKANHKWHMIEVIDKDIKTIITTLYMFKKLKEWLSMLSRDMEDVKENQTELIKMKTTMSKNEKYTGQH